jgi:hypothetical protein
MPASRPFRPRIQTFVAAGRRQVQPGFFQTRGQPETDTIPFEPSDGRNTLVPACSQAPHKPVSDLPKVTFNRAADAFH